MSLRDCAQQLGIAALFVLLAKLSLLLGVAPVLSRSLWLPAALVAGLVAIHGTRFAAGLALGAGAFGALHFGGLEAWPAIVLNIIVLLLQVVLGHRLLLRLNLAGGNFTSAQELIQAALILGPLIATVKALVLLPGIALLGLGLWEGMLGRSIEWITIDAISVVLLAPLAMAAFSARQLPFLGQSQFLLGGLLLIAILYGGGMYGGAMLERERMIADVNNELDREMELLEGQLAQELVYGVRYGGLLVAAREASPIDQKRLRDQPQWALDLSRWRDTVQQRLPEGWTFVVPGIGATHLEKARMPRPALELSSVVPQLDGELSVQMLVDVPAMRRMLAWSTSFLQYLVAGTALLAAFLAFSMSARGAALERQVARSSVELSQSHDDLRMFKAMADQSTEALAVTEVPQALDERLRVVYLNASFEALTQYGPNESAEFTLIGPDTDITTAELLRASLLTGQPCRSELYLHRKDGSSFLAHCSAFPITDRRGDVTRWVCIYRDITQQRAREHRELEAQRGEIGRQRHEQMGRMAANLAHDFNNLLTAVVGGIERIRLHSPPPEISRLLADVQVAVNAGAELTQQMLAFAGGGAGRIETLELAERLIEMHRILTLAVSKRVRVYCRTHPEFGACQVRMDAAQYSQLLLNLVVNAAQAIIDEGAVKISVRRAAEAFPGPKLRLRADSLRAGDYVRIEVVDDGVGIPEPIQARIFEPFFTTREDGSGLGLAAVAGVVRQNGGWLEMESSPQGTRIAIFLPALSKEENAAPSAAASTESTTSPAWRVLVVDDESSIRHYVHDVLQAAGYHVEMAIDGIDAGARLHGQHWDVMLTDLTMPRMGGMALIRSLDAVRIRPEVVVMTGYSTDREQLSQQSVEQIHGWLRKPFSAAALLTEVKAACTKARTRTQAT